MKMTRSRNSGIPAREERGIALVVTLWVMALLSLLGATFLSMSATESTISSNEANTGRAFNIAEAGLERAKARVKNGPEPVNNFLGAGPPGPSLYSNVVFDGGIYTVVIEDDNDDLNQDTDINNRVFIRSTGTLGTAQKQILALVEKPPPAPPSPLDNPRGSAEIYTSGSLEFGADGGGSFDGRNWTPPANIAACVDIINCGTLTGNPPTYGSFKNIAGGVTDLGLTGTMYGTGCLPPCDGTPGPPSQSTDTTAPLNRWDSTIDALKALATRTVTPATLSSGTQTWGTAAAPEITVVNSATVSWGATINGAGVLIFDGPGTGIIFGAAGVLNWQGLVIIRSPGSVPFELENGTGRIRVFGQVVNRSVAGAQVEINGSDKNFIKYSSAGMNLVRGFLPPPPAPFTVRSWQEVGL